MLNTLKNCFDDIKMDFLKEFSLKALSHDVGFYLFNRSGEIVCKKTPQAKCLDAVLAGELAVSHFASGKTGWVNVGQSEDIYAYTYCVNYVPVAIIILDGANSNSIDILCELFEFTVENLQLKETSASQLEKLTIELSHTYEELALLYKMSKSMRFTQSSASYLQAACDNVTELVDVEGIAILLEREDDNNRQMIITAGSGIIKIDRQMIDTLELAIQEEIGRGRELLLDSRADGGLRYNWADDIRSVIAIPLHRKGRIAGMMVAVNRCEKADFDSIDAKLFNTVANECAVFIDNDRLFADLKELFVGSLKALSRSIDAKDQYTRGHSERVAYISRWIAQQLVETEKLNLSKDEINRIYLAGLLHDIGKIGIDEKVLGKQGALDDHEWQQIRSHPTIGSSIIGDIKQMRDIIPGVVAHHERIDGKGYPNGLRGDEIPVIAKIIAIADAFDAMISKRVYRNALSIRQAVGEIEKGLGFQFDEMIGEVFLASDHLQLWDSIQDGFIESWDYSNFAEYGAEAVGTLLQ